MVIASRTSMRNFTKRHTNILKGFAILLLLMHHVFPAISEDLLGNRKELIDQIVSAAKLCVGIFTMLSGYGMYKSYQKHLQKEDEPISNIWFMARHIFRLYETFWIAAIPSIIIVGVTVRSLPKIFGYPTISHILSNLAGTAWLTNMHMFVNSWWYISAILIYYCLFPFVFYLVRALKWRNYILAAFLVLVELFGPGMSTIPVYGCFFVYGMITAEREIPDRFLNWKRGGFLDAVLRTGLLLLVLFELIMLRQTFLYGTKWEYYLDFLPVLVSMLLLGTVIRGKKTRIPGLLEIIGILSFPIYLTHGIFLRYYGSFVLAPAEPWRVFLRLFWMSLAAGLIVFGLRIAVDRFIVFFKEH